MPDTIPDWAATASDTPDWAEPAPDAPQLKPWTPTLRDRASQALHALRTSGPVETILGRTPEEIAAAPALDTAPTTHDAGVMGLFENKTPVERPYENPTTALDGLHNWAAGVVNSIASPGGIVSVPLTGPAKLMGPIVQKALLLTFGAQGAKLGYEGAKDLVQQASAPDWAKPADGAARTVMDVGNILAGGLMTAGGVSALGRSRPNVPTPPPLRPAEDWLPPQPVAPVAPVEPPSTPPAAAPAIPTATSPPAETATPLPVPAPAEPLPAVSAIAERTFAELAAARKPLPAGLLPQAGIAPTALAEGYRLNAAGDAYEFTEPPARLTPEQEMARANVAAMAELRAAKAAEPETVPAWAESVSTDGPNVPTEAETVPNLLPVDVTPAEIKAAGGSMERPPDILDAVGDHYPDGVRFHPEDQGEAVRQSRGAAAEHMFTSKGEPADAVLKGLHEAGLFQKLETPDDLAAAMREAGERRVGERGAGSAEALELARELKRTQLFEKANRAARPGVESLPVEHLFVGERFKLNGQEQRVTGWAMDAETGQPYAIELDGAYGRQTVPVGKMIHLDEGTLITEGSGALHDDSRQTRLDKIAWAMKGMKYAELAPDQQKQIKAIDSGREVPRLPGDYGAPRRRTPASAQPNARGTAGELQSARPEATPQGQPVELTELAAYSETALREAGERAKKLSNQDLNRAQRQMEEELQQTTHPIPRAILAAQDMAYRWELAERNNQAGDMLAKLDALKMDTRGQLHAFGLLPEIWNTLIEGVKLAVRGGMKLREAIDAAVARLKASGADLKDFNESGARAHIEETMGIRQFGEQLQGSQDISKALKGTVTNTLYERRPQETDQAYAARIVQDVGGPDRAVQVFRHETRLPQPVRMAIGMQILKSLDAAGRHVDAANFFDLDLAPHTTDVAQGLAMLNAWHAMSPTGKLDWARLKILRAANDAVAPVQPDITAAQRELQQQNAAGVERTTADPQVQHAARQAITEAVVNSPETHAGIVMELAQPWASSEFILNTARQHVAAKANELLNVAPRPVQFTPSQYLRRILDDLARRAADIAAGHYQGAEPGVVLKDKLKQRLGITEDAAMKLANALDKEFARQVAAAKDALPKRLAAQLERAKKGLPQNPTETAVDKSIRRQLEEKKTNLGQLVHEHWTKVDATGAELKDKLVKQAGLDPLGAEHLADIIQRRFEALTAAAKRRALEMVLKPLKRLGLAKSKMVERLVQLSNLGAFDEAKFWNAIRERMNLPEWTTALHDRLKAMTDTIGRISPDRLEELQRAQTDFLNIIERAKGVSNLELSLAFYMQNILSGLTTHVRVALHTSAQIMAATAAETSQAIISGRIQDLPLIYEALARGAGRAVQQQKDIMRSGLVVGSKLQNVVPLSVLEQIHFGERGGTTARQGPIARALLENRAAKLLNLWKYNARLITAQHMLYYAPAEQLKLALLASRQARSEGLSGRAAVDRARLMLGYGAAQVRAAEAQAMREGLEGTRAKMRVGEILQSGLPQGMKQTARDYALRQTFLNDPYGFAGTLANLVASAKHSPHVGVATAARVIVPFTRIAANLFNEGLNYTPVGTLRARFSRTELLGHKFTDLEPEAITDLRRELYAKSALGMMLLTGVAFKAAQGLGQPNPPFTVYGAGPTNPDDKAAWRAAGGIPYSIKVGKHFVSYANTPANVMFATLGNYLDGVRDAALYQRPGAKRLAEDLPMRTAAATIGAGKVIMEQPFLQSLVEIAELAGEGNPEHSAHSGLKVAARTGSSFVVPNLLRQMDRFYDPTLYDQRTLAGILTAQVPFVRQQGRPMLNALGQPIQSPVFGMFASKRTDDPMVQTLTDYNAWPSLPARNQTTVNGVPLSDDEFYLYSQVRGRALANFLGQPAVRRTLDTLAQQTERLNRHAEAATNIIARYRLEHAAASLQGKVIGKFETAADRMADAAVMRQRGY